MNKLSLALVALFVLEGCATEAKYNKELESFVNQPVENVEAKFGKPSAVKMLDDGSEVISYTKVDQTYIPSEYYLYGDTFIPGQEVVYSPFNGDYDFYPFEQSFGYTVEFVCQTSFLVDKGIVKAWRWKGNNCVAD